MTYSPEVEDMLAILNLRIAVLTQERDAAIASNLQQYDTYLKHREALIKIQKLVFDRMTTPKKQEIIRICADALKI